MHGYELPWLPGQNIEHENNNKCNMRPRSASKYLKDCSLHHWDIITRQEREKYITVDDGCGSLYIGIHICEYFCVVVLGSNFGYRTFGLNL